MAADDESREDESVDEAALVVDEAAVEGFPEVQVVAEVLRQEVWKEAEVWMESFSIADTMAKLIFSRVLRVVGFLGTFHPEKGCTSIVNWT